MFSILKQKIKNYFIENNSIPTQEKSLARLKANGFYPSHIFDVGAYKGDFALSCLNVWPDSKITMFEALSEKLVVLKSLTQKDSRLSVIEGLVGEEDKQQVLFNENETASSVLTEHISTNFSKTFKTMRRLDSVIVNAKLKPTLLKIDTQGYEYQVLKGIEKNMNTLEVILAELNLLDIHKDVKLAGEVISYLDSKGFILYDICELHRRPLDDALWQVDVIFVQKNSSLRLNKAWA